MVARATIPGVRYPFISPKRSRAAPDAFGLTTYPFSDHYPTRPHKHNHVELVVVTHGQARHLWENTSYTIQAGAVLIIPLGVEHGYADCKELDLVNVIFDPVKLSLPEHQLRRFPGYHALFALEPLLRAEHQGESRLQLSQEALHSVVPLLQRIDQEVVEMRPGYEVIATGLFTAVVGELCRHYAGMTSSAPRALVQLSSMLEWLEGHYQKPLTIEDLMRRSHMSRRTLERHFQGAFDLAPMSYLTDLRLRKAAALLRDTDMRVSDVALSVGMTDANYFTRKFRQFSGLTPKIYRLQSRTV